MLYPTIVYKNMTLHMNFGPTPRCPLPFRCPMLADAAEADTEVAKDAPQKDGKCEVVFPMALPEQGGFDWLDNFLKENPSYVELSDRTVLDWATKSGLYKPRPTSNNPGASNDKPHFNYGIPLMDDFSIRKVLNNLAPTLRRNFVVMEVRSNLIAEERKAVLRRFGHRYFKKTAMVLIGQPDEKYLARTHENLLADKAAKVETERKRRVLEKERKRVLEEKNKLAKEARAARLAEEDWWKAVADAEKEGAGEVVEVEVIEVQEEEEE